MSKPFEESRPMPDNINTPSYWDHVYRQEWESGSVLGGNYHRDYGPIHEAVIDLIGDRGSVLEIACGAGVLCRKIKERRPVARVVGVDFSAYTIERNAQRDAGLGVEYHCLDIRKSLTLLPDPFDVVLMCEILEHLDEPEQLVAEAIARLKPGGRFVLTCPHDDAIPDPEHVRCWGHDDLFHLLAPYSATVSFMHFPPPYFHIWMLAYLDTPGAGNGGQTL